MLGTILDGEGEGTFLAPPEEVGTCLDPTEEVGACLDPTEEVGACLDPTDSDLETGQGSSAIRVAEQRGP